MVDTRRGTDSDRPAIAFRRLYSKVDFGGIHFYTGFLVFSSSFIQGNGNFCIDWRGGGEGDVKVGK